MIRNDVPNVDAFGDSWMQFYCEHAIDMGLLDSIRTSSSYSQLSWVMHFLQNLLTWCVVILTLRPVGVA